MGTGLSQHPPAACDVWGQGPKARALGEARCALEPSPLRKWCREAPELCTHGPNLRKPKLPAWPAVQRQQARAPFSLAWYKIKGLSELPGKRFLGTVFLACFRRAGRDMKMGAMDEHGEGLNRGEW